VQQGDREQKPFHVPPPLTRSQASLEKFDGLGLRLQGGLFVCGSLAREAMCGVLVVEHLDVGPFEPENAGDYGTEGWMDPWTAMVRGYAEDLAGPTHPA